MAFDPPSSNTYYLMRHGESEANRDRVIVSHPAHGLTGYGLTAEGRAGVEASFRGSDAAGARHAWPLQHRTPDFIYTSDFLRARQTAEIVADLCPGSRLVISELLRERSFGEYEGLGEQHYEEVWRLDRAGDESGARGIETPDAVAARLRSLLAHCEGAHQGAVILLVSHGDPLQILLTITAGLSSHRHREMPHLDKGEIRPLLS